VIAKLVACTSRPSYAERRAAVDACGSLLLDQLPPAQAAAGGPAVRQEVAAVWTALITCVMDPNPYVCLAATQVVRRLFLNATSHHDREGRHATPLSSSPSPIQWSSWLPLARFVRQSLRPRLPLLLERLCSLDVRYRACVVMPLLQLVLPLEPYDGASEEKTVPGGGQAGGGGSSPSARPVQPRRRRPIALDEGTVALAQDLVTERFIPMLTALSEDLVYEVPPP
jgi:hypothetical protein